MERYIVIRCPEDLYREGAAFTTAEFESTLSVGYWPIGMVFQDRLLKRKLEIVGQSFVELNTRCMLPKTGACCCKCKWHIPDKFHHSNSPRALWGKTRGFVCMAPHEENVYSDWARHGECERLHDPGNFNVRTEES